MSENLGENIDPTTVEITNKEIEQMARDSKKFHEENIVDQEKAEQLSKSIKQELEKESVEKRKKQVERFLHDFELEYSDLLGINDSNLDDKIKEISRQTAEGLGEKESDVEESIREKYFLYLQNKNEQE